MLPFPRWVIVGLLTTGMTPVPRRLVGQALSGRVVDRATRRPLAGLPVRLLSATPNATAPGNAAAGTAGHDTTALARGVTGPDGVFVLTAPTPGTYRVRIGDGFVTPPVSLAGVGSFEAREYHLALPPAPIIESPTSTSPTLPPSCTSLAVWAAMADGSAGRAAEDPATGVRLLRTVAGGGPTVCTFQIEKTAAVVSGTLQAPYPKDMLASGVGSARVVVQFVVDTTGVADLRTFRVLASSAAAFIPAVRAGLASARFYPAEIGHRKVRQRVELPFTFTLTR